MPNVAVEGAFVGIATSTTTVGSVTPTPLPATALTARTSLIVYNEGTDSIFCGGASVTTATGVRVPPGGERAFPLSMRVALWAIAASGNQDIRTLELA